MSGTPRLSADTLKDLPSFVVRPRYERGETGVGHVHLGVGAFMRAHIAVYSDEAMNRAGGDWCIAGVSLRSGAVRDLLQAQDSFYHVAIGCDARVDYRLIGAIKSVDVAPQDTELISRLIADPKVRIVTLTVTEKGYGMTPDTGALDTMCPEVAHDLASLQQPQSTLGTLVAGLLRRRDEDGGPLTILSCDNVPHNGPRLRRALADFIERTDSDLQEWLDKHVCFPATMVDRIVPATTGDDLRDAEVSLGQRDAAVVRTEPFTQWVIEDNFAADRPAWGQAGALFVSSVEPYEMAKLRLLNGAHSALAYLGYLAGYEYVHQAIAAAPYAEYIRHMMTCEISPVTPQPEGMAHAAYIDALFARFLNPSLKHRTWQIAMDGSQKLPQRLLNTVRDQLARDGPVDALSLAVAAWMRYALGTDDSGGLIDVLDPLAPAFADIARNASDDASNTVRAFFRITSIFGDDLATQERFVSAVTSHFESLSQHGVKKTLAGFDCESGWS